MHMTENSNMPQSARMRAQIQANTGNFGRQRFSLHGVDLTKFDGGGARDVEDHPSAPLPALARCALATMLLVPGAESLPGWPGAAAWLIPRRR